MKIFYFFLSVIGLVITSFFLFRSLGTLNTFNDYIFAAVQVVLISIWVVGILMHKDVVDIIIRKVRRSR